jgi:hypothetical protein
MSAKCHVWTAPSWQELSSRLQSWSVQPCVRPLSAEPEAVDIGGFSTGAGEYLKVPKLKFVRDIANAEMGTSRFLGRLRAGGNLPISPGPCPLP